MSAVTLCQSGRACAVAQWRWATELPVLPMYIATPLTATMMHMLQAATQPRDPRTLALRSLAAADRTQVGHACRQVVYCGVGPYTVTVYCYAIWPASPRGLTLDIVLERL